MSANPVISVDLASTGLRSADALMEEMAHKEQLQAAIRDGIAQAVNQVIGQLWHVGRGCASRRSSP